jgi:hypothetical protein
MKVVSETLGHSSLGITSDTYTVFPQVAQAAAEATAALVPRARSGTAVNTLPLGEGFRSGKCLVRRWAPGGSNPEPAD